MAINFFAEAEFHYAWELPFTIRLFETEFRITVSADAYYETDQVTEKQNDAYQKFMANYNGIIDKVEKLLLEQAGDREAALERFTPEILKIGRDGACGLVFDDKEDAENGLVITIFPAYGVTDTDAYF